jgi:hypothetical protein
MRSLPPVADALARAAAGLAAPARKAWLAGEAGFRDGASTDADQQGLEAEFLAFLRRAAEWLGSLEDSGEDVAGGRALGQEIRPFLVRSTLVDRALHSPSGHTGDTHVLAHILLQEASGDGVLGELFDRVLLRLPTCEALCHRAETVAHWARGALPLDRGGRVVVVQVGCGSIIARLIPTLGRAGGQITCLDESREALAFLDAGLPSRPRNTRLNMLHTDLADLASAPSLPVEADQDLVLLNGLVEYLPDALVVGVLRATAQVLGTEGRLLISTLAPSWDSPILDHLLGWPTVRRSMAQLSDLVGLAGLEVTGVVSTSDPALVVEVGWPTQGLAPSSGTA